MTATPPRARRPEDRPYFFDAGLRFGCTQCGQCCTGAHGTIFMNREESGRIAQHLGLARGLFLRRFAYPMKGGHSLREKENGDCVFFADGRCAIYTVRPTQCRTYPFWPENLRSEAAWSRACRECPGIGEGRLFGREEILALVQQQLDSEP
jgi:Fe-S-cluster containining protein